MNARLSRSGQHHRAQVSVLAEPSEGLRQADDRRRRQAVEAALVVDRDHSNPRARSVASVFTCTPASDIVVSPQLRSSVADSGMPLQNRVTPEGEIIATPHRGLLMGNRGGCFHLPDKTLGPRRWASRQWIACVLEFKGRHRELMQPNRYTELFFLDEATALSAGHRPCFECRRADADRFAELWARAFGSEDRARAPAMDDQLHAERVDRDRRKVTFRDRRANIPSGAFIRYAREGSERAALPRRRPQPAGLGPGRLQHARSAHRRLRGGRGADAGLHRRRTFSRIPAHAASLGRSIARLSCTGGIAMTRTTLKRTCGASMRC